MRFYSLATHLPLQTEKRKKILLGSGGFGTEESRAYFSSEIDSFLGDIDQLLLIPFAQLDSKTLLAGVKKRPFAAGRKIINLDAARDPVSAAQKARAFLSWGGNTFKLLEEMQSRKLLSVIRKKVESGTPYVGVSAGTLLACPSISTTNDMPAAFPKTLNALNLVPFQINPHYFSGPVFYKIENQVVQYMGESRDDRLREYLALNPGKKIIGIPEGTFLKIENGKVHFCSHTPSLARLFESGKDPVEFETRPSIL